MRPVKVPSVKCLVSAAPLAKPPLWIDAFKLFCLDSQASSSCLCYECSLGYLITLSALASTFGGIVRPICFAAFRLMMSSNFFGCSTGRSAGLAPLRILST